MDKTEMDMLYDEVVDQIQSHLHRGDTVAEAQDQHAEYCASILAAVPSMDDVRPFLKDLVISFVEKFQFVEHPLLKRLLSEADASHLDAIRTAKAVLIAGSVQTAWQHIVLIDGEAAVVIIALSYRLGKENKLKKLLKAERGLEKLQQSTKERI